MAAPGQVVAGDPRHYVVLFLLDIAAFVAVIIAWFAILFTGRYSRGLFDFVAGVPRWYYRRVAFALNAGHRPVPAVPPKRSPGVIAAEAPSALEQIVRRGCR